MSAIRRAVARALLILFALGSAFGPSGCSSAKNPWEGQPGPPRVVVSFPPLYCFVKNVAGDDAGVLCLCSQQGPHDYQYSPEDVLKLRGADLFLTNGLTLDGHFTSQLKNSSGNSRLTTVELGDQAIPREKLRPPMRIQHGNHTHLGHDPHVWLGIPEAILMVQRIRDELKKVDPARAARYDERAAAYVGKLEQLHKDGLRMLADKKDRKLVGFHDYLYYFARAFGLEMIDHITPQPGVPADQKRLTELAQKCKEQGARVVTSEPQYDRNQAQRLLDTMRTAGVTDPEVVVVDPLETVGAGEPLDAGWYERKMRENLDNLARALR